jgi:desumoylating isopeptidase 1
MPYLKIRSDKGKASSPAATSYPGLPALLVNWTQATTTLAQALKPAELFPLVDMWRVALLDPATSGWVAYSSSVELQPLAAFLDIAASSADIARNYTLTVLRMLANAFSSPALTRRVVFGADKGKDKERVARVLVQALLSADAHVRTAAASVAFNVAAFFQKGRNAKDAPAAVGESDGDWEVELITAIVEAIQNEVTSEEVGELLFFYCYYSILSTLSCFLF